MDGAGDSACNDDLFVLAMILCLKLRLNPGYSEEQGRATEHSLASQAFLGLFSGNNIGKMLVDLRDDVPFATG